MRGTLRFTPIEARVIAALAEKSVTTPQYYPMTVNAIMLAASQKSSRNPVMSIAEGEVGAALNRLEGEGLVKRDDSLGRVPKWWQQLHHHLLLQPPAFALLVTLMLRGPQTLSELRANAQGLGGPPNADLVAAELKNLADRAQPLVVLLPRAHGQKEARYAHSLNGPPSVPVAAAPEAERPEPQVALPAAEAAELAELKAKIRQLEERVAALEALTPASHSPAGA